MQETFNFYYTLNLSNIPIMIELASLSFKIIPVAIWAESQYYSIETQNISTQYYIELIIQPPVFRSVFSTFCIVARQSFLNMPQPFVYVPPQGCCDSTRGLFARCLFNTQTAFSSYSSSIIGVGCLPFLPLTGTKVKSSLALSLLKSK